LNNDNSIESYNIPEDETLEIIIPNPKNITVNVKKPSGKVV
jgi:hypothetical protein